MDIVSESPGARVRAHLLSYRGQALLTAAAVALIMVSILIIAVKSAAADVVERVPLMLEEPGPPPLVVQGPGPATQAPTAAPVKMKPIACPNAWERPNVTCWQAQ